MQKSTSKESIFNPEKDTFHSQRNDILILGIGNYLMGDEGVGVHFINKIDTELFPKNISFLDGGTGGFTLIAHIESHPIVILVDATMDGQEEGTITLLRPKFSNDFPTSLSGHNFGLKDMVEILTLFNRMPNLYLFTISISKMTPMSMELSPNIKKAIPLVTQKVLNLVNFLRNEENAVL